MEHNTHYKSWVGCLLLLGATSACDKLGSEVSEPGQVEVDNVNDEPSRYYGKQVTVSGEVETVYGPQAFRLEGEGLHWGDDIYVLTKSPVNLGGVPLKEDQELVVRGKVQRFVKVDLERELGWTFDSALELKLREQPVVVASTISKIDKYAQWSAEKPDGMLIGVYSVTIAPDPAALVGQSISFEDIPVRRTTPKGAWVGYGPNSELYVMPSDEETAKQLKADTNVDISGTLRAAPDEKTAKQKWQLTSDHLAKLPEGTLYIEADSIKSTSPEPTAQRTED